MLDWYSREYNKIEGSLPNVSMTKFVHKIVYIYLMYLQSDSTTLLGIPSAQDNNYFKRFIGFQTQDIWLFDNILQT